MEPSTTLSASLDRRSLLRGTGAALGAGLVGLSGCSGLPGDDGGGSAPRVDAIPDSAVAAVYADLGAMLADEEFRATLDELLAESGQYDDPPTVQEALDTIEERAGLDPRQVSELLAVVSPDGNPAALLWTDFEESAVRERAEARDPPTSSYGGRTVYDFESSSLALLGDGRVAVGTDPGLRALIDRDNGDAPAVEGQLRTAYETARSGYVQFAVDVPTDQLPEGDTPRLSLARDVRYAYGSLAPDGDSLSLSVSARAEDANSAGQIRDQIEAALTLAENELAGVESRPDLRERAQSLLDATEVSADGPTVTVRNSEGAAALAATVAVVGTFLLGFGTAVETGGQEVRPPQIAWEFTYDSDAGQVTITHEGGDVVPAERLSVAVDGRAAGTWPDLGGSASMDDSDVAAGDSLTVAADPGATVRVVWQSAEGNTSATLGRYDVPN